MLSRSQAAKTDTSAGPLASAFVAVDNGMVLDKPSRIKCGKLAQILHTISISFWRTDRRTLEEALIANT